MKSEDENTTEVSEAAVDVSPGAEAAAAEGSDVAQANPDPELTEAAAAAEKPQRDD